MDAKGRPVMVLVVFAAIGLGVGSVVPVDVGQRLGNNPDWGQCQLWHVDECG